MPSQRPDRHPWRGDRLGRSLRSGLGELGRAEPGSEVWERIAREIEPPRRRGLSSWLSALAIGRHETGFGARLSGAQRPAVLLGTMTMAFVLAVGNLFGSGDGLALSGCIGRPGCSWDRLSRAELSIQTAPQVSAVEEQPGWLFRVVPARRIDREARLRRLLSGKEAYNRSEWLRSPPAPSRGPVMTTLAGQVSLH